MKYVCKKYNLFRNKSNINKKIINKQYFIILIQKIFNRKYCLNGEYVDRKHSVQFTIVGAYT